jgi:hypothetical protein
LSKLLDLTWLGQSNDNTDNEILLCEFCDIELIPKADDTKHLGLPYDRMICSRCGFIYDNKIADSADHIKHKESLHTITDSNNDNAQPHVSVIPYSFWSLSQLTFTMCWDCKYKRAGKILLLSQLVFSLSTSK